METSIGAPRTSCAPATGLAALLLAFGNGISLLPDSVHESYAWLLIGIQLALAAATLAWAHGILGIPWEEIGFRRTHSARHAGLGVAAGVVLILPVVLYFLVPIGLEGGEIDYDYARESTVGSFAMFALVKQPLGTSFFEESMFRGALQALGIRAHGTRAGVVFVAVVFALWHVVVNLATLGETNAASSNLTMAAGIAASMAVLFIGGVVMSVLRLRTGSLVAPIAFHWSVAVLMQGVLFLDSR